jgi:hypothetical protein
MEIMRTCCLRFGDGKRRVLVKVVELLGMMVMLRKVVKKGGSTLSGVSL